VVGHVTTVTAQTVPVRVPPNPAETAADAAIVASVVALAWLGLAAWGRWRDRVDRRAAARAAAHERAIEMFGVVGWHPLTGGPNDKTAFPAGVHYQKLVDALSV
jgi:hypothetical protein